MSCGNPNTNRDEQLARQLQREEYNISSNSNLAKKYQEVYDKEANIYGFDPVFDIDGNKNLANKIRAAERNNVREDDIDLIFQKHANERRKFLAKSEKINEKIIDKPLPKPKPLPVPKPLPKPVPKPIEPPKVVKEKKLKDVIKEYKTKSPYEFCWFREKETNDDSCYFF